MNHIVPRLTSRNDSSDTDSAPEEGPPSPKRRRRHLTKKCTVVLEDISRSKDFCVRSTYR